MYIIIIKVTKNKTIAAIVTITFVTGFLFAPNILKMSRNKTAYNNGSNIIAGLLNAIKLITPIKVTYPIINELIAKCSA